MTRNTILYATAATLLGASVVLAQGQPQQPRMPMTFFVTSTVPGTGSLGGLAGADQICQNLAMGAGAGNHTWHAYLSQQQQGNLPQVNARDRIGPGPWHNAKGDLIASNVADLHGDIERDRNAIRLATAITEKGEQVPGGGGPMPNQHDMMTGSDSHGRAFTDGIDHTCNNWTSAGANNRAMLGHHDRGRNVGNTSWNAAHMSRDCTKEGLIDTGGAGRFYCFAVN